ncbi:hypothetical protein EYF80_052931 [Liparis tanakae]|uniref:Uncharacterized protein n=1 Tax=Liparis tanakae TaxID=230148 RepID=A0A4Z2F6U9_9TELE|nr:hypothetical protein EYF80_052931 [Liparis tanakae]
MVKSWSSMRRSAFSSSCASCTPRAGPRTAARTGTARKPAWCVQKPRSESESGAFGERAGRGTILLTEEEEEEEEESAEGDCERTSAAAGALRGGGGEGERGREGEGEGEGEDDLQFNGN